MRASRYLVTLLAIALIISQLAIYVGAQEEVTLNVDRSVTIGSAYAHVTDVIRPSAPLERLKVYFPFEVYKDIKALRVEGEGVSSSEWMIGNDSMILSVRGSFTREKPLKISYLLTSPSGLLNMTDTDTITISLPIAPMTEYHVSKISARMSLPGWVSEITRSSPKGIVSFVKYGNGTGVARYSIEGISPMNRTMVTATFKGKGSLWVSADELEREIIVGYDGSIEVHDRYVFVNRKIDDLEYWDQPKIKDFKLIEIRDKFSKLTYDDIKKMWVLRYFVKPGEKFELFLVYKVENRSAADGSTLNFNMDLTEGLISMVERFVVTIVLPSGATVSSIEPMPDEHMPGDPPKYMYYVENAIPDSGLTVRIEGALPTYMGYVRLASTAFLAVIVVLLGMLAYITYVKPGPAKAPRAVVDITALRDLLSEKYRLLRRLDELEDSYRSRKIRRREFIQRRRALRSEISRLESEIKSFKSRRRLSRRVTRILNELEELEAVLRSSKAALRELEADYKSGRLAKTTYMRIYRQRTRDIERAYGRINELLDMLGREIEER